MVSSLYHLFKEIDSGRRDALEQMAIVDRVDYEAELTDMEAEQEAMGHDSSNIEYLIASPARLRPGQEDDGRDLPQLQLPEGLRPG